MKRLALCILLLFIFSSGVMAYSEARVLNLSRSGITSLDIDTGAGDCIVKGVKGLEELEVTAEIWVMDRSRVEAKKIIEKNLDLSLKKRGDKGILVAKFNVNHSIFTLLFGNGADTEMRLVVKVPEGLMVNIDDGSGDLTISDLVGDLDVEDGSGNLKITNTIGGIDIDDGSGSLELVGIEGDLNIEDGSGDMMIRDISGSIIVDDGSGSIYIDGVGNDVTINEAGSGGVNIINVQGKIYRYDD